MLGIAAVSTIEFGATGGWGLLALESRACVADQASAKRAGDLLRFLFDHDADLG